MTYTPEATEEIIRLRAERHAILRQPDNNGTRYRKFQNINNRLFQLTRNPIYR